jgi:ferrous iron transport protein B
MEDNLKKISNRKDIISFFKTESKKQKYIKNYDIDFLNFDLKKDKKNKIIAIQKDYNKNIKVLKNEKKKEQLYYSYIGRFGKKIEPIFKPLGFDWRIDIALFGALSAKEIFISQLGVIFASEKKEGNRFILQKKLKKNYSKATALSILVFILISAPCIASITMTKKETNSYKFAIFQFFFLTFFAYIVSFVVHKIGNFFI